MATMYALVFTRDFAPGEHWLDHRPDPASHERFDPRVHRPRDTNDDRRQHWKAGEVYSYTSVLPEAIPPGFELIAVDHWPPLEGEEWLPAERRLGIPDSAVHADRLIDALVNRLMEYVPQLGGDTGTQAQVRAVLQREVIPLVTNNH